MSEPSFICQKFDQSYADGWNYSQHQKWCPNLTDQGRKLQSKIVYWISFSAAKIWAWSTSLLLPLECKGMRTYNHQYLRLSIVTIKNINYFYRMILATKACIIWTLINMLWIFFEVLTLGVPKPILGSHILSFSDCVHLVQSVSRFLWHFTVQM